MRGPAVLLVSAAAAAGALAAATFAAGPARAPTFHQNVDAILRKHCDECHRPGDVGPQSFVDYDGAASWAGPMLEEIDAGRMPPWRPTRGVGKFVGERGLTAKEIDVLRRWREAGAPEGKPTRRKSAKYPEGWLLGAPDQVLDYGASFTVQAGGDDAYRCFPIRNPFGRDVWLAAIDVQPGDRRVVHHVVMYVDSTGDSAVLDAADPAPGYECFGGPGTSSPSVLGGWAPGSRPRRIPAGTAMHLGKDDFVVMQCHYHAGHLASSVDDRTTIGLYESPDPNPTPVYLMPVANTSFTIPAGAAAHPVEALFDPGELTGGLVKISGQTYGVLPHMHLLGKSIAVDLLLPDGTEQRLVEIRDWDFEWQDAYGFPRPIPIPAGTKFRVRSVYDNSAANPVNPHSPPQDVTFGERTTDEMCLAFLVVTLGPAKASAPPVVVRATLDRAGRLVVTARGLGRGGRIEIDDVPRDDSTSIGPNRLRTSGDASASLPVGTHQVRVRRADGRLSKPSAFVR